MQSLAFWQNWKPADRYLYLFSFAVLLFTLCWYIVAYFIGNEALMQWEIIKDSHIVKTEIDSFQQYLLNFSFEADNYAISQTYQASPMQINTKTSYLLLGAVVIGLLLVITIATYLSNTWFFALLVPLVLYFVSLHIELKGISQYNRQTPLLLLFMAYMPLAYYFQSFATHVSLRIRLAVFASITCFLAVAISIYSKNTYPAIFLANSGLIVPMALSALFLALNGHEIIRGLLWLVIRAGGGTSGNTHLHFVVVSFVYLLNLLYAYFHYVKGYDWGIFFLEPLWVLPISVMLGVWGFARRQVQYDNLLDFAPKGALLYNGLAIITLATAAYGFSSGNDSLQSAFVDIVMFTHLAFGGSFVLYTLSNFLPLLKQGKDIHKVIYKPYRLDYLWVLIGSGLLIAAAVFYTNYSTYQKMQAAYYNSLGDAYKQEGNLKFSEFEYQHALEYDFGNYKSNYSLAGLAKEQNDYKATLYHYQKCLARTKEPFIYANVSEMYLQNEQFLDALLKLREGIKKFPQSGELANNFALLFSRTSIADSTLFYFEKARQLAADPKVPAANLLYWLSKKNTTVSPDSLHVLIKTEKDATISGNELVIYNQNKRDFNQALQANYLQDSILQPDQLCYLYNYTLNKVGGADTTMLAPIRKYNSKEENAHYTPFFNLALALKHRAVGNGEEAFRYFERSYDESSETDYQKPKLLATYLFENEQFLQAAYYFSKSYFRGNIWGRVYQAFAMTELENRKPALEIWEELRQDKAMEVQLIAKKMLKILHTDSLKKLNTKQLDEQSVYYFVHYNQAIISNDKFNELFGQVQNADLRFLLATERMKFFISLNQPEAAESLRNSFTGLTTSKPELLEQLRLLDLHLLWKLKRFEDMKKLVEEANFQGRHTGYKNFYLALIAEQTNDSLRAEKHFALALKQLPLNPEVPIAFAQYYNKQNKKQAAYNLLIDNIYLYPDYQYYPVALYEMYILQAISLQFTQYAEDALPKLFEISPKQRYDIFYKIYQANKKEIEKLTAGWE
jgi:hypothetical protein